MRRFKALLIHRILPLMIVVCACIVLIFFLYTLSECSDYFDSESTNIASNLVQTQADQQNQSISTLNKKIETSIAGFHDISITTIEDADKNGEIEALDAYSKTVLEQLGCTNLRMVADTNYYVAYEYGASDTNILSDEVTALFDNLQPSYTQTYYDQSMAEDCIVLYYPISLYDTVNGVLLYFPEETFMSIDADTDVDSCKLSCLSTETGSIIKLESAEEFPTDVSHNIITYLYNLSTSKPEIDTLEDQLSKNKTNGCTRITISGDSYLVAFAYVSDWGNRCYVLSIFDESTLMATRHSLYSELWGCAVFLVIFTLIMLILFIFGNRTATEELKSLDDVDTEVGGNSYGKFKREAAKLIDDNSYTKFAFIYISINNFTYLKENHDEKQVNDLLRFLVTVFEKSVILNESYGHIADDKFAMLLHYTNTRELANRLQILGTIANNYEDLKNLKVTLKLDIGVFCPPGGKKIPLQQMMDRAVIAHQDNEKHADQPFSVFDNSIQSTYLKEVEIEAKQEFALKNHDFKLFFQPMYNIAEDRIEGAEVLVRWYDSKTNQYISPADFVPLFEINGFVNKMDRFVFEEVCSYMNQASRRGDKITHCNVNVSHVTASQPDFVDFYVSKKREYGIPNDYLTLEFSESFAFKNYDAMKTAVLGLRKAGFGCTIDDFGSSFSSYRVLKELPMSEVKLHKFFIWEHTDAEHDQQLLGATIGLGKSCGLKVIQAGVETKEQLELVHSLGCDVIQGFYYAKPMLMSDFIDFVNRGTDLKNVLAHQ